MSAGGSPLPCLLAPWAGGVRNALRRSQGLLELALPLTSVRERQSEGALLARKAARCLVKGRPVPYGRRSRFT